MVIYEGGKQWPRVRNIEHSRPIYIQAQAQTSHVSGAKNVSKVSNRQPLQAKVLPSASVQLVEWITHAARARSPELSV